jgi:dTMP kinase
MRGSKTDFVTCTWTKVKRYPDMAFIVFEGLDGAGKSTLIELLKQHLKNNHTPLVLTREPGGTELGDEIRQLLLRTKGETPVSRAELFLYQAGRAQHVEKVIRPSLAKNIWVLCDRYYASTVAFQCGGRELDRKMVNQLNMMAIDGVEPDLWVLLDLTTEEAAKRMQGRELDRFESENRDFHERVRKTYLDLAKEDPKKWLVLDASVTSDKLFQTLILRLQELELLK